VLEIIDHYKTTSKL